MADILPLSNGNLAKATLIAKEWLETFPVFQQMLPLQLGIYELILSIAPEHISPAGVKNYLIQHTLTPSYLHAIVTSDFRYDLQSKPVMGITDEEREYSQSLLNPTPPDDEA